MVDRSKSAPPKEGSNRGMPQADHKRANITNSMTPRYKSDEGKMPEAGQPRDSADDHPGAPSSPRKDERNEPGPPSDPAQK